MGNALFSLPEMLIGSLQLEQGFYSWKEYNKPIEFVVSISLNLGEKRVNISKIH